MTCPLCIAFDTDYCQLQSEAEELADRDDYALHVATNPPFTAVVIDGTDNGVLYDDPLFQFLGGTDDNG